MASTEKRQQTAILYTEVKSEVKVMLAAQAEAQRCSMANYLEWLFESRTSQHCHWYYQ